MSDERTYSSSSSTISISLQNGEYSFSVGNSTCYQPVEEKGSFTVNGSNVIIRIDFIKVLYRVTFTEVCLSNSTPWCVNLSIGESFRPDLRDSYTFYLPIGNYSYTVSAPFGYSVPQRADPVPGKSN
ncbi:hypothetical protein [Sulfuracidifex tepidarius]|uniref:Thermopsin n=1 Tax=Sulfuracidifex tepidarius TaxID=1294262 RepID=A0A510DT48_9CREN|nr:hypothetical protein [Sulfuracidifex tepidarius]BBG23352.1 hypothetical protein IC006_0636 [Sulfuracidifex tepidarius]BBG26107.1 hypothetical protein IC007_0612 [Sulfuracidifex tepidarius]